MPELDDALESAAAARRAADAAAAEVVEASDDLTRLRRGRAEAARRSDPRDPDSERALAQIDGRIARAEAALAGARERAASTRRAHTDASAAVGRLADPRRLADRLSDDIPVLLMPVRIETRFKGDELWVRVYPDDWAVDAFEERLSEVEVANARHYWAATWRAGGDPDLRRAAWRGLVSSQGSGRAGWILAHYQPVNPAEAPVRVAATDVILVVDSDDPLPAAERPVAAEYWEAVWRAGDDLAAREVAHAALEGDLGPARADAVDGQPPYNLKERPARGVDRATVTIEVAFLDVPPVAAVGTKTTSWTEPPRARVLPDRFVLLGYAGGQEFVHLGGPVPPTLEVGPDPSAAATDQLRIENGELVIPDALRWMVDFDRAVEEGMGFRVKLDDRTRRGFDRLLVLGLRVVADPAGSQSEMETLLRHHASSRTGLALVPQGTPTNNTEEQAAGLDRLDDPDASYDRWFGTADRLEDRPEWERKQDGQWLAEALGLDPAVLEHVAGAAGTDQAESRAMNQALWPATWGYFLESMLHPALDHDDVDRVRDFVVRYVSGRGLVPAIRVGRQPYGILPTTALSRLRFDERPSILAQGAPPFAGLLDAFLRQIAEDWRGLVAGVPHVGGAGDPHQLLLDLIALHPASVEFHQRYAETVEDLFNRMNLGGFGGILVAALTVTGHLQQGRDLLARLGYTGPDPEILAKIWLGRQQELRGPLIDDRPLSETEPVRDYTADGRNYLEWLVDATRSSLDALRRQEGFLENKAPTALLYLLLRHALLLSWRRTSLTVQAEADVITRADVRAALREPTFVHVTPAAARSESRWEALYVADERVTGDAALPIGQYVTTILGQFSTRHLTDVVDAVSRLSDVPTARLERAMVEHLDCCSYRLDAWRLGLVNQRLLAMRLRQGAGGVEARRGIHLGAYGWLENVRPEQRELAGVRLGPELAKEFADPDDPPLLRDSTNGGFVHAPSVNHAATAAVLRSGYLANATPARPGTMAVNLSSERVRFALGILEGIRNGQPLGALLGYRFERGLHDRHALAEVDKFIQPMRLAFPLRGDLGGRQVVDGRELVAHIERTGSTTYPFGRTDLPGATSTEAAAINLEIDRLRDVHDAVADLALAEGVHQAVLGNYDRVASTLDAYSKIGFPPDPAVVETPRSGISVTHRFGVHLRAGLDHTVSPVAGVAMTPRATAEPAVNEFLAELLPLPANVGVRVSWTDPPGAPARDRVVTQEQLGLQPIDVLHLLHLDDRAALGDLDERMLRFVEVQEGLRPDATVEIRHTERLAGVQRTFFEIAPLVDHARSVLQRSRPLRPSDVLLHNEARDESDVRISAVRDRPAAVRASVQALRVALTIYEAALGPLLDDPVANRIALLDGADGFVDNLVDLLAAAGLHGLGGSGWGEVTERRRGSFRGVLDAVTDVVARWERRLAEADALLARDTALPLSATDEERFELLMLAERQVRAALTDPRPATADLYRATVEGHRNTFVAKLGDLRDVGPNAVSLSGVLATVRGLVPLSAFDEIGLDLVPLEAGAIDLCRYVLVRATLVGAEADRRAAAAQQHLVAHDATASPQTRVDEIVAATRALLGEDAVVVHEFTLAAAHGDEWEAALSWSRSGQLTAHLATRRFAVDDWLHGVARVREKVRSWEQLGLLGAAVGRLEPDVHPIQLPHATEPWLALELPPGHEITGDRLLYTAHYPAAFAKAGPQCGLLLDEWTEIIPGTSETTGVGFHFDRPDAEPPQAMLLVVPPEHRGAWRWEDLVAALHETLELAKSRAVEPGDVDGTPYAAFLPATVMAATVSGISIAMNLSVNNGVLQRLGVDDV